MVDLSGEWLFKIDPEDVGLSQFWYSANFDRTDWEKVEVPSFWERYSNFSKHDGIAWYYKSFEVKRIEKGKRYAILFGGVDDDCGVWLNGEFVGEHRGYSDDFYFDVTKFLKQGINELVVMVYDHGGPGGIYKPVAIVEYSEIADLLKSEFYYKKARKSEDWVKDAIIYEIYPRAFSKEGTFKEIEKEIPRLKELGINVIWFMPIHPIGKERRKGALGSPYSVKDYYEINPEYGTKEDFKSLVKTAHENGIKVIIDLVINHTAWDNELIKKHPDWYSKNDVGEIISPNSDWTDVADLNYDNPELRKYMLDVMKYWVKEFDIDGYRCDVAELVPIDFWNEARKELDKIKPVMMLAEGSLPEQHLEAFDLTYSWNVYDALARIIRKGHLPSVLDNVLESEKYKFPKGALRLRFNENHDKPRATKFFGDEGALVSAVIVNTIPGVPLIYNGQEYGDTTNLSLFEKQVMSRDKSERGIKFYSFYKKLLNFRKNSLALKRGEMIKAKTLNDDKIYAFWRKYENELVLVVANLSTWGVTTKIQIDEILRKKVRNGKVKFYDVFEDKKAEVKIDEFVNFKLEPFGFKLIQIF
ncbi:MAG: alpha-amylase family glycosyl hydrolase [Candidatus Kryptonium sp.]